MLNSTGNRELAYLVKVDNIKPIEGRDRVECAEVGGWTVMVQKNQFHPGDIGIYFEVDSKVPEKEPFLFLDKKKFKIKIQKFKTPSGQFWSQGLLMHPSDFGWTIEEDIVIDNKGTAHAADGESRFLTKLLDVTYADAADNKRKAEPNPDKAINAALARHPKFAKKYGKTVKKNKFLRWFFVLLWGRKRIDNTKAWPVGKFPGVSKTDQERVENMIWVLQDKTPFVKTEKCDGSSGTYILERKGKKKFEFYVCSRNVRMSSEDQECFYGSHNYYWEVAKKYSIQEKMIQWLNNNPEAKWVCWQGEICAPGIQKNPHHLKETHFYCFHWTDSLNGRLDIRKAKEKWKEFDMEIVPIIDKNYILPDNFEEFKKSADGVYNSSVCEGNSSCSREGYVYYKTTDPTFSFKNVSREYLAKH